MEVDLGRSVGFPVDSHTDYKNVEVLLGLIFKSDRAKLFVLQELFDIGYTDIVGYFRFHPSQNGGRKRKGN